MFCNRHGYDAKISSSTRRASAAVRVRTLRLTWEKSPVSRCTYLPTVGKGPKYGSDDCKLPSTTSNIPQFYPKASFKEPIAQGTCLSKNVQKRLGDSTFSAQHWRARFPAREYKHEWPQVTGRVFGVCALPEKPFRASRPVRPKLQDSVQSRDYSAHYTRSLKQTTRHSFVFSARVAAQLTFLLSSPPDLKTHQSVLTAEPRIQSYRPRHAAQHPPSRFPTLGMQCLDGAFTRWWPRVHECTDARMWPHGPHPPMPRALGA